jgi:flavin-dependent dehydrogenase
MATGAIVRDNREQMTASRSEPDVVIAGSGPAGASLAIRLARAGLRVRLLDREVFPRPKPCGEFVSPECLPLLGDLGVLDQVRESGPHPVHGMALRAFGRAADGRYGRRRAYADGIAAHGFGIRREVLDAIVARHASRCDGVTWSEGFRVTGLLRAGDRSGGSIRGVEGIDARGRRERVRARYVVGADGLRSRVAACLGARGRRGWLRKVALTTRFEGVSPSEGGELHLFPGGYFAACTVDRGLFSLNLVLDAEQVRGGSDGLPALLDERVPAVPTLAARLESARRVDPVRACGPFGSWTRRRLFDGAALVGDAAGYVDPMTGEGISYALIGSARLAQHLVPALAAGRTDPEAVGGYERAYRRELRPRQRASLVLQAGLRSAVMTRSVVTLLQAFPALFDRVVESTGGAGWFREPAARIRSHPR